MRIFKHTLVLLLSLVLGVLINAQSTCNSTTSKYPILIDATTESLETGLESGLFTSVDLVNAYIARILEVNATLHVGRLSFRNILCRNSRVLRHVSAASALKKYLILLAFVHEKQC